jgi:polyisoprenoid-binding protein YceI
MRLPLLCFLAILSGTARLVAVEFPLAIDAGQSRVEIAVRATADSFVGRLSSYEPMVTVRENGALGSARFAFHFRDVVTGKNGRDKAMHEWQHTDRFPDGLFVLTSLEPAKGAASTATGRLTFHGVTRDIQFPVTVARDGPSYAIDGDAAIDTREFGLPKIRMLALLTVDPVVHVRFHLQGTRGDAAVTQP